MVNQNRLPCNLSPLLRNVSYILRSNILSNSVFQPVLFTILLHWCVYGYMYVCVWERERARERDIDRWIMRIIKFWKVILLKWSHMSSYRFIFPHNKLYRSVRHTCLSLCVRKAEEMLIFFSYLVYCILNEKNSFISS